MGLRAAEDLVLAAVGVAAAHTAVLEALSSSDVANGAARVPGSSELRDSSTS